MIATVKSACYVCGYKLKKTNSMKKTLIAFVAIVSLATSCKKEKEEAKAVTKENVAGTYKIASVKMQLNGGAEQDITSTYYDACELDDQQTLKTDMTYLNVDAGTQCMPAGDITGTWDLPNSTTIVLDGFSFTIKSFTGTQLVVGDSETSGGVTTAYSITLNKQ